MTMIDSTDSRFTRALELADGAAQWLKCRTADGRKAYGIRSSRDANHVYFVTTNSCTCYDAQKHACKHQVAVAVHCARVRGSDRPASDVIDGLAHTVSERQGPVLDMIREADGSIRWERHEHADGSAFHMPRPVLTAQRYDDIFKRFEGE